jgi:hypothetical protein
MSIKTTTIKIIMTCFISQVLLSSSIISHADNPPTLPHRFYGTVRNLDAHPVSDGLVVRARIVDLDNHSSQNFTTAVLSSAYDFDTQIQSQNGHSGDIIFFYINSINTTQNAIFIPGGNTELNLIYQVHDEAVPPSGEFVPSGGLFNNPPIARAGGPYSGFVNDTIIFNGSKSTDSDGTIVGYRWDFTNDGIFETLWLPTPTTTHSYEQPGSYVVKLQVKDNGSATDNDTANVTIKVPLTIVASPQVMDLIRSAFNLNITIPFSATDTDRDGIVDKFMDPNGLLKVVHVVTINGNVCFLLSISNETLPDFFWDTSSNTTTLLTFGPVVKTETWIDPEAEEALIVFTVEKSGWMYITLTDPYPPEKYPNFTLSVKTMQNRTIPPNMIWRENGTIFILDDPAEEYILKYSYTILPPIFNPSSGAVLTTPRPTITVTYFENVTLLDATLNNEDIIGQLTPIDQKTFTFTPGLDLINGTYTLNFTIHDDEGNRLTSTSTFTIRKEKKPTTEVPWWIIILIAVLLLIVVILIILRRYLII